MVTLRKDTNYSDLLKHGEAVAIGMNLAAQFSVKLGFANSDIISKITQHLQYFNIPINLADIEHKWNQDKLLTHMLSDKKNQDGVINFILLNDIGKAFWQKM